jgi:hypothetical protein
MASRRFYAYYIRGSQIAIVEEGLGSGVCSLSGYSNQTTCEAAGGTWTENAFSSDDGVYRSPVATIADGLEIEYAYSPRYLIESTDVSTTTVSGWDQDNDGNFRLRASGSTNWTSSPNLSSVTYIVLRNAGRWNGLHKVSSVTNNRIVTTTKVSASTSETLFEETVTLYYDINALEDESDTIDLPEYLAKGLVYYVKAKIAEDQGDIEQKNYNMKEFRRILEKHESSKIRGPRMMIPGGHGIR